MTQNIDGWFETSVTQLSDPQHQRVWSIIVSLFGDMAQAEGDQISGSALTRVITPMGIKPEAIRVALHRLRKDGWIESERAGRASVHFLTDYGRSQSAAVTPRIYDRAPDIAQDWHVLIADDSSGQATLEDLLLLPNYIAINRQTALGHGPMPQHLGGLLSLEVSGFGVPVWLKTRFFPADLAQAYASLLGDLNTVGQPPAGLHPLQIAALRTLVVHRWRRVVLRHPDLAPSFHPAHWPGEACRSQVFNFLDALSRPAAATLNAAPDGTQDSARSA